ncbi:MAG TPA: metal-dependent transcriptional regulator [Thermoanaerobaculales bacterium]|nr:metal-dependent transcriptional regulator [Thermoanaerobaculales bacterium]HQN97657.1 metal-dependent transcriptional regulator [Thermoanaerobaculales bacterium]HQP42806.1 metal-dependent transcriptional regulator [Thermoanaerobaculales bacterium]
MGDYEKVWREFERNEVTHSVAHYLLAVAALGKSGREPRAVDVARALDVSRAAVSLQVRTLRESGLVDVTDDHRIHLTRTGADLVARIASKREVVRLFLAEVLGVDPETAERDACKIEHLISEQSGAALVRFIGCLRADESSLAELIRRTRAAAAAGGDGTGEGP